MKILLHVTLIVAILEVLFAMIISFVSRIGPLGEEVIAACTRAPMLDFILGVFTWIPWIVVGLPLGWRGLIGTVLGQIIALHVWVALHEAVYRKAVKGPRIVKFINRTVGRWQNHVALWITAVAFPGFLFIRLMEVALYPLLVKLLRFPKYNQSEWVNVSRQKFDGLVGHDLIWCLYCDWMTGVYSLGTEMLRNVESFWCPIRFYDGKKCENCREFFPDIDAGWVPAHATMQDVENKMQDMYGGDGDRSWFNHPVRLTVNGKPSTPA